MAATSAGAPWCPAGIFQPPPKTGTGGACARAGENLERPCQHGPDELLGRRPMATEEAGQGQTMRAVREAGILWRLVGADAGLYGAAQLAARIAS